MTKILDELGISFNEYIEYIEKLDSTDISNEKLQMMEDAIFLAGTVW
jgi:hypothetical protein